MPQPAELDPQARVLEAWATLVEWSYERRERRAREVIEMVDALQPQVDWLTSRGLEQTVLGSLLAFRNEAVSALVEKAIDRSERAIDRAKTERQKMAQIKDATATFAELMQEFGESDAIARELLHLHDQWLQSGFYEIIERADAAAKLGKLDQARDLCNEARLFAQTSIYPHAGDRQLNLDEVNATIEHIEKLARKPIKGRKSS